MRSFAGAGVGEDVRSQKGSCLRGYTRASQTCVQRDMFVGPAMGMHQNAAEEIGSALCASWGMFAAKKEEKSERKRRDGGVGGRREARGGKANFAGGA